MPGQKPSLARKVPPLTREKIESLQREFDEKNWDINLFDEFCLAIRWIASPDEKAGITKNLQRLLARVNVNDMNEINRLNDYYMHFNNSVAQLFERAEDPAQKEESISGIRDITEYFTRYILGGEKSSDELVRTHASVLVSMIFEYAGIDPRYVDEPIDRVTEILGQPLADMLVNLAGASMNDPDAPYDEVDLKNLIESMIYTGIMLNVERKSRFMEKLQTRAVYPATGRNDPCPCGSGKKYKNCCLQ